MNINSVSAKKVRQLVRGRDLIWLPPTATAREAAMLMREKNIGAIAVLEDGKLVGLLSERDIVQRCVGEEGCDPAKCPISKIMSHPVITIDRNMSMGVAVVMMLESGIRHLPVVKGQQVLGMISIRQLVDEFKRGLERSILQIAA